MTPKHRGPAFIMVTNFPLSFGGPFAVSIFLIVLMACGQSHYSTVWRVCFGIGCIWPLSIFYFRIRMLNSALYRRGAIKKHVPYMLVLRYYWKSLIGTCGAWFLYGKVHRLPKLPNVECKLNVLQTLSLFRTVSFQARSSHPLSQIAQSARRANGNFYSEQSPSQVSSSALSFATASDARTS